VPNTYKMLGQAVGTGSAASVYSPSSGETGIITSITVVNDTGGALSFALYLDDDGTTYTSATQVLHTVDIPSANTYERRCQWPMNNAAGNLAFDGPAGLTITVWGVVKT
jgi:hypothetical protein